MKLYNKKIIVDPRSNYSYGSFYLYELIWLFGHSNVVFDIKPFLELNDMGNDMRFIAISDSNIPTKYFIHTNDSYRIQKEDYDWCDIYGCVNANFTHYPKEQYPKLKSLVPALGKCIISTQLSNDLPYPLEHGKNIHFVENSEQAMRDAIEYIIAHPEYKHRLEQGAREYWSQYGTPEASLKLLGIIQ